MYPISWLALVDWAIGCGFYKLAVVFFTFAVAHLNEGVHDF